MLESGEIDLGVIVAPMMCGARGHFCQHVFVDHIGMDDGDTDASPSLHHAICCAQPPAPPTVFSKCLVTPNPIWGAGSEWPCVGFVNLIGGRGDFHFLIGINSAGKSPDGVKVMT